MEYVYYIQTLLYDFFQNSTSVLAAIGTAEGLLYLLLFIAAAPRISLFISGRIARFFKVPRLIVRAYNGIPRESSNQLAVIVSGIRSPKLLMTKTTRVIAEALPEADILKLCVNRALLSNSDPNEISAQIGGLIAAQYSRKFKTTGTNYDKITLVGHSVGALWLRKAVLNASAGFGIDRPALTNKVATNDAEWRTKLDRIIMLAGINGGFDRRHNIWVQIGTFALEFMGIGKLALAMERGQPFVETLRCEWMRLTRAPFAAKAPYSIQLVGDADWVIPSDNDIDLEAQVGTQGNNNHAVIDVGGASHLSILDMALIEDSDLLLQSRRAYIFVDALTLSHKQLQMRSLKPLTADVDTERQRRAKVKRVIFVYDDNKNPDLWIETIPFAVKRVLGDRDDIEVARESPPILSRFSFIMNYFGRREAALRWWNAKHTALKADYPNATISAIALENGTWIIGQSLQENRAMHLQTLFLSGSLLPRKFDWERIVKEGRLGVVCNTLANQNIFAAVIGGFFEWINSNIPLIGKTRLLSVGDSGIIGFNWVSAQMGEIAYMSGTPAALLDSRATIRFAAAFAAFGGPMKEANNIALEGFKSIQNETNPEDINLNPNLDSSYSSNIPKPIMFMNKFAWAFGALFLATIIGGVIGAGLVLYAIAPLYQFSAFLIVTIVALLILDSL